MNLDTLKYFFEDCDLEYHKVIRHVATAIFIPINKIKFSGLKSYFILYVFVYFIYIVVDEGLL